MQRSIFKVLALLICLTFLSFNAKTQTSPILIDGLFSDWENIDEAYLDPTGDDDNSNIDFARLWLSNDEDFLFIRIEIGKELNLQSSNTITLYLDTDNDASTGLSINGIGAEISYNLGQRNGQARLGGFTASIDHSDIGLVSAPTVTSDQFELAINRRGSLFGEAFFPAPGIKIAFEVATFSGDQIPDQGNFISYIFDESLNSTVPEYSINKLDNNHLRLLSYNVLFDNLFEPGLASSYERMISTIAPDIIGFQEIYDYNSSQTAAKIESFLPSGEGEQWYHAKIQPDIIAVSRYPIIGSHLIQGASSGSQGNGAFLIDLNPHFNSQVLLIVAHTPCCDNDEGRQREIDAIMAFIRNAKDGNGPFNLEAQTPIIIAGDMNLVGQQRQLQTLLNGDILYEWLYGADFAPDWDETPFEDALPFATHQPLAFTWYNTSSSFSPGRLDFVVYSGSVLELKNTYALFTPALPSDTLLQYDLVDSDATFASDHLPLVADFELNLSSSVQSQADENIQIQIHPNPFKEITKLQYHLPSKSRIKIQILDGTGKVHKAWTLGVQLAGTHSWDIARNNLPAGIYFCQILTEKSSSQQKMLIID